MKREIRIFFTALMFYTRIPCPSWVGHEPEYINLSVRYFPLIGWIVALLSFAGFWVGDWLAGNTFGVLLSLAVAVFTTGAFHEDGFADVCDGFGGGWTKTQILTIMKDSRLGTFGAVALLLLFMIKASFLNTLTEHYSLFIALAIFISAHALSRFIAATFVFTHTYVREDQDSKAKPVAKQTNAGNLWIAAVFGFGPLLFAAFYFEVYVWLLIPLFLYLVKMLLARFFLKWIGGYTGDCLGCTQQVTEVVTYLLFIVAWKFI